MCRSGNGGEYDQNPLYEILKEFVKMSKKKNCSCTWGRVGGAREWVQVSLGKCVTYGKGHLMRVCFALDLCDLPFKVFKIIYIT